MYGLTFPRNGRELVYTVGHSRVLSTGVYIPEARITSREVMQQIDCENRFGVKPDWLERVTGIKERRVTPPGLLPSDMATIAAKEALDRGKISASDIDAIVYAGLTRDYSEPATAHLVQSKLRANNASVFDVSNACHGFMNGVHLMDALIATGQVRRGLVVTGEQGKLFREKAIDHLRNCHEKSELVALAAGLTLGDAGAAVLMGPKLGPDMGFMGFMLHSQGQHADFCTAGGPLREGPLVTDMPAIVSQSLDMISKMFTEFLFNRLKWTVEDLKVYIIHQVGGTSFKLHYSRMGVPVEIMPKTVTEMGNLITATIPVNLHKTVVGGHVAPGQKVYLSGAGSGISISQAGLVWDAA